MKLIDNSRLAEQVSPLQWREWASPSGARAGGLRHLPGAIVQSWSGSESRMVQPPLDHHLIVLHQGGPKRVHRSHGNLVRSVNVPMNSCTTVEAGHPYEWSTEGPIAFIHIYVEPQRFAGLIGRVFGRDPAGVGFGERIGQYDTLTAQLALALAQDDSEDPAWLLAADYYLDALLVRLASTSHYGVDVAAERLPLAPSTVKRVRDYILAHLAEQITLDDLASVAGYSRYHFVRAFRDATGHPPYGYVITQRIAHAQQMLLASNDSVAAIAHDCGFATHAQFSKKFKEIVGTSPAAFRRRDARS